MTFIAYGAFFALGRIPPFEKILMKPLVRFAATPLAFLLTSCLAWADWKPVGDKIKTRWAQKVTPDNAWREYPRPQMVREDWQNLNGLWDYTVRQRSAPENNTAPETWVGKILVPYCIESSLSGVGRILQPNEELWYQRTFEVSKKNSRKLLHFEAVDYQCEVWINGQRVGAHNWMHGPKRGSGAGSLNPCPKRNSIYPHWKVSSLHSSALGPYGLSLCLPLSSCSPPAAPAPCRPHVSL